MADRVTGVADVVTVLVTRDTVVRVAVVTRNIASMVIRRVIRQR